MPHPRHQAPRRHAWVPLLVGSIAAGLLTTGVVYAAYDRVRGPEQTRGIDESAASGATPPRATNTVTVGRDPAARRMTQERAEARRQARMEALAQQREEAAAAARREARRAALQQAREERAAERQAAREAAEAARNAPVDVRIGTFNVLGSQHTDADGPRHQFPPASVRTARTADLVAKHGVDILGAQEIQDDQLRDLQARTGMAAYPGFAWGEKETDNSILWDPGVFELVQGTRFTLTFVDRPRPQPIIKLRHLATGRELFVINTHTSPGGGRYLSQRRNGQAALVSVVNDLRTTGLPVLVTGDMNDRAEFYCNVVPQTGMSASNGGGYGGGCAPPPEPMPVDWVVGSDVSWSGYWRDTTPQENRVSDHFFVSALARLL